MKFLEPSDLLLIQDLDKNEKNKWRWQWLDEESDNGVPFRTWCRKIDAPGSCYCVVCNRTLIYSSAGKKALRCHANDSGHSKALKCVKECYSMPGDITCGTKSSEIDLDRKLSVSDRVQDVKAIIGCFIAEHCLPYSISSDLINVCKRLSKDPEALSATSMARTAATYTMTHGIAEHMKRELSESLKGIFFSINVDEATNNAGDKVLNVLCQFYDDQQEKVVVDLLGSRVVNVATSENILNAVKDIFLKRSLDFSQIISATMDNCSTMRGSKTGFEQKLKTLNPFLLDVSGDTVHMLNNASKSFFEAIDKFCAIQSIVSDIFYDIEDSPKLRSLFRGLQIQLFGKAWSVIRVISTRFLQMLQVCDRIHQLWDALILFYHTLLLTGEKEKHKDMIETMLTKYNASASQSSVKTYLNEVIEPLKKQKSSVGNERKDRILLALFQNHDQTLITLQLYRGILRQFNGYAKTFQAEKPQCHLLHTQMFQLIKDFYSQFISPEHIPILNAKKLFSVDTSDPNIQLRDRKLGVGEFCCPLLKEIFRNKAKSYWLPQFFSALRSAYGNASKMLKKMPLLNSTLIELSCLDPGLQRSSSTTDAFMKLAERLPNIIPKEKLGILDRETKAYSVDDHMTQCDADETDPDFRLDTCWWGRLFKLRQSGEIKYPLLSRLVKALLSIFSGPLVESTFNIMDDILEDDQSRMTIENYEGYAMIKSHMRATNQTATTMNITPALRKMTATAYSRMKQTQSSQFQLQPSSPKHTQVTMSLSSSNSHTDVTSSAAEVSSIAALSQSTSSSTQSANLPSPLVSHSKKQSRKRGLSDGPKPVCITKFFKKM